MTPTFEKALDRIEEELIGKKYDHQVVADTIEYYIKHKVQLFDVKIDDACDHEDDTYVMCSAFEVEDEDVVVRVFYGNNSLEIGYVCMY